MKGFGEKTGAVSLLKERRKVRPRDTFLEKLGGSGEGEQRRRQGWPLHSWAGDQVLRQTAKSVIALWLIAPFVLQRGKECHEEI